MLLCLVGLLVTWLAVRYRAQLGTASAPFLGHYRLGISAAAVIAPVVAFAVLRSAAIGWHERVGWPAAVVSGYLAFLVWTLALTVAGGFGGLGRAIVSNGYLTDAAGIGDDPMLFLSTFTARAAGYSDATRGHPPGPVLLLWTAQRIGLTGDLALGVLISAIGALTVPLVLAAVRGVCGEQSARRYLPVLALAPYAVWLAGSVDAVIAALGAAMVATGVYASARGRTGWSAALWATLCGILLGLAAMFSYAAPWLGLSVVCLYFARRRPFLNAATGVGVLLPVVAASLAGFSWPDGLMDAHADYAARIGAHRSPVWWAVLSLVALLLAAGPALVTSLRKMRNTPGWPFLVGAGAAVVFSLVAGLARGGIEYAWLPFFPWLTVAAVAPERPGGPPPAAPLLAAAAGALAAIVIAVVLVRAR